jgi:hypothetical protein
MDVTTRYLYRQRSIVQNSLPIVNRWTSLIRVLCFRQHEIVQGNVCCGLLKNFLHATGRAYMPGYFVVSQY